MTTLDVAAVRADRGAASESAVHPEVVIAGRYRLTDPLGGGSEAYVKEALDLHTGNAVAIKIFRNPDPVSDVPFHREVGIHGRLRHKNIVRVLDSGATGDEYGESRNFLVMELVAGKDLRSILHQQPATPRETAEWMGGIARALAYIHRKGIVHNDVKPGNILVNFASDPGEPGVAQLTDFGIAIAGASSASSSSSGTPHYLSPEEVRGGTSTAASDIYSLGLVALECLTGTKAFPGPPLESMVARTLGEPRIPGTVRRRWSMVLHAMTDPEPAGRPSASQVVGMFRRLSW
ncbi:MULTISPECIES: serine/threonine-protein kinase [Paenarthrobacter]|uniref:serine/threonine-protein kinase n=1 Tax=Paenarthrobacter TaxID=1742992 RepID=UPI00236639EB|nr:MULTISPECIES: serine/threonine-protein kinase [Paenarthrobacter]MDD7834125.1 serine/threonine-protein kinase [Paenarthrobacter sp. AB444]MDP9935482.1 serine/threonine protein kinase [Paenarthrobacter nicotinovorans]